MIEEEVTDGTDRPTSSANASSSNADVSGDVYSVSSPEVSHDDDHLMCRVCRGNDGHLFYPCRCTGSIKYVHQECLTEWLKYSKKEVCELCNYKYSFQAIYRADMPKALPIRDIVRGLAVSSGRMIKTWLLYSIVLIAWLGLVPLTACRIYNIVFYTSSINELTTYPSILFRTDNVFPDVIKGGCLLAIFVCTFISLVWLREQIIHGGPQDFLDIARNQPVAAADVLGENRNEANRLDGFRQLEERDQDWRENDDLPDDYHMEETDEESDTDSQPGFEFHREERLDEQEDEEESGEEGDALPRIEHNDEQNGRNEDAVNAGEDNWRDWDRLGDELTWQRLLGLDGSLVFLEHVFWVISLNTLFTVIFAYLPYRLGFYALGQLGAMEHIHYFPSVAAIIAGYFMLAFFLYGVHSVCGFFRWKILFRLLGIGFLVLKVFLLVLLEIGLFPIICGSWIDLCSMSMFSSTLSSRVSSFTQSPVMQVFVRWLVGMVYVFYSASFVILLREVLRPGVLWFLRNLNDPEFNPIQEMIDLPVSRHIQRIVASTTLFFTTIFLIVYLPLNIIKSLIPTTLPYNVSWTADTPLSELSLELLVLQVLLPALLEQTQARVVLREAIKLWCQTVGKALDLDGFLLPEEDAVIPPAAQQPQPNAEQAGGGLAAEHQALLLIREPQGAPHPYTKPSWFALRIFALLGCMGTTWTLFSTLCFFVPVTFGRVIIRTATGLQNVHDLYTTGCGLYVIWSIMRIGLFFYDWFKMETVEMQNSVKMCFSLLIRCSSIIIPSIIIVPFLLGTFFQLVFVGPLRLDSNQTALTFLWQDWAMGVLHLKIVLAVVMMGPEWWLRTACDRIYQDGFRNLRATRIMCVVVLPVILSLASAIAIPHLLAVLIATVTGASSTQLIVIHRLCYPICAVITLTVSFACWQYNKFKGLADTIRNEKYLVGTRLINYEREAKKNN